MNYSLNILQEKLSMNHNGKLRFVNEKCSCKVRLYYERTEIFFE